VLDYYAEVIRKYAVFDGRAGRAEYWWFFLANLIVYFVLGFLSSMAGTVFTVLMVLYALAIFLPSLGVTIRRLHDTNRSGWWIFIGVVPVIGAIALLVFYASQGTGGENRYGAAPA
jgi:uncharacterized membrane protein YhaH (DUF805 family)